MSLMADAGSSRSPGSVRLVQLDVLRGIAICLVLFRHSIVPWSHAGPAMPLARATYYLGWTGVDLFFVLSGFLIGGLLFSEIKKTGRLDVKRFLVRRGFKIWPAYFVLIGFVFVRLAMDKAHTLGWAFHQILPNLLHLQNYLGTPRGLTWSLAVEEHFYLALPLLLLLWVKLRGRGGSRWDLAVPIMAIAAVVVCNFLRVITNWDRPWEQYTHLTPTHLRIDGLMFGVLLAFLYHMRPAELERVGRHRWWLLLVGLVMISPMALMEQGEHPLMWTFGYTLLYVGYGCILLALVYTPVGEGMLGKALASPIARAIAWIGVFSYSIYLWQYDLGLVPVERYVSPHLLKHPMSVNWLLAMMIYFAVAIFAGAIMAKLIEMPALALRERIAPARARAVKAEPAPRGFEVVLPDASPTTTSPAPAASPTPA